MVALSRSPRRLDRGWAVLVLMFSFSFDSSWPQRMNSPCLSRQGISRPLIQRHGYWSSQIEQIFYRDRNIDDCRQSDDDCQPENLPREFF